jgi:hypothetical protein
MQFHLTCRYDNSDGWLIRGLPRDRGRQFGDLAKALDYAKHECAAEPADIELFVDGFYIVTAFQERGWPRQLCCPAEAEVAIPARAVGLRPKFKICQIAARIWRRVSDKVNWQRLRQGGQPAGRGPGGKLFFRR